MSLRSIFIAGIFTFFLIGPTRVNAQESIKESEQLDFAQGLLSRGMYDMAILEYQKFIYSYPKSPSLSKAYLSLGEGYFLSQDFDKAANAFTQFNLLYPNSEQLPLSLLRIGQIDIHEKKYDEALKELTTIDPQKLLAGPMLQSFDFYMGQAYLGRGDAANALMYYQKATQVDRATDYTADAFEEIGKILAASGKYDQAMDAYTRSMQLAGDDQLKSELTYRIAEVNFMSGNYADAIKGFQENIDKYSAQGYARDALANILLAYFNLGQYDRLLKEYQEKAKEVKFDDASFAIHFAAVRAYIELKDYDKANKLSDQLLAIPTLKTSARAKVFTKKADILIRKKKYKDGLAMLDAYSTEDPDNADENLFLKAQCYFGIGEFDRAFTFYENVYLNFPHSRFYDAALLGEAHSRKEAGRNKESEILFLKFYNSQGPADLRNEALYDAVMMAIKAGDVNGAISSAQEYLRAFPDGEKYSEILLVLAEINGKNNHAQDAVNLLQGYLAKPGSPRPNSAYFLLGLNQQILGNNDQAIAAYAQVDGQKEKGAFYVAALKNMAIIYLDQKNFDKASSTFGLLINQSAQNDLQLKTYIWVCNEYLKKQKYDDVLRIANEAEAHFASQDLMEIRYFKAEALRGMGNCDDADKDYGTVIASAQKNVFTGSAHIGYGLCLEKANKFDEAKKEFQKALDENADDYTVTVHARFETAGLDVSQGNVDEALKIYLLVATIYDDDYFCSECLLRAGRILENQKRKAEALKLYTEILDKYKNSKAAVLAKQRVINLK